MSAGLRLDGVYFLIQARSFVTIVAAAHYIKLFQFHISNAFVDEYEEPPISTSRPDLHSRVYYPLV